MKRISRAVLMTLFSLIVLGTTQSFAGNGKGNNGNGKGNSSGNNGNHGSNSQGNNNSGNGGGIIGLIEGIIQDIFGGNSGQGNNNQGNNNNQGSTPSTASAANGGGTAPIDGGIGLLLVAGLGMGVKKMIRRKDNE